jgi:phosphoribosylanthranilate isomerase
VPWTSNLKPETLNLKLKICGMREQENMLEIAALRPDFFGLIFYPKSPRFVSLEQAKNLPEFPDVSRVGVFVNESLDNILQIAEQANLSVIQLHGNESPEFCAAIKRQNLQIIKAFGINENFDSSTLKNYETVCDYFLFDTKTQQHGGSGKNFDWTILQHLEINRPFFLSGGISAENAGEAIKACANLPLFALDVNSKAEIAPGIKSYKLIQEIIHHRATHGM